jgi:molybdopterin synthase catalytic subunit
MFELTGEEIDIIAAGRRLASPESGALVSFAGCVRNHNEGRSVDYLEYEAYPALAQREADSVLAEARSLFAVIDIYCVHRVGKLAVGDLAIWIGVLSSHRAEAFSACRYVIDEIKARLPIWKKEHYTDGTSTWVNCAECSAHAPPGRKEHDHSG